MVLQPTKQDVGKNQKKEEIKHKEKMKNRKGDLMDGIAILPILLFATVLIFAAYIISSNISDQFGTVGLDNTPMEKVTGALTLFDYLIPALFVSTLLTSVILAYYVDVAPFYFGISIIVWIISIFLASVFSDVFTSLAGSEQFITTSTAFPVMLYIMQHLPHFIVAGLSMISIALYSKWRTM